MSIKEQITKIKEYADLAWAGYALLHYIEEKEEFDLKDDEWMAKHSKKPPARWIYPDGIKRGYEVKEENLSNKARNNHRSLGQPTAYALAIEASFSEDQEIQLDKNEKPKKIDNMIQNFIYRSKENPSLENQKIKVSITQEKMIEEKTSHYLSTRTKAFTSRYELLHHQPNTSSGFSATLFYDIQEDKYIASFRGTEKSLSDIFQDIALSLGFNPQSSCLINFLKEVSKRIKNDNKPIVFVGHSLGGYLAQVAYIYCEKIYKETLAFSPSEVYTFNAPSVYGWNLPAPFLSPNIIKIALDFLEKNIIDISEKITHIYDKGGVEIIASAQYGAENQLALYTGENSHSIIPITQSLYFYEYLLQNQNNHSLFLKDSLQESCDTLSIFLKTIYQNMYDEIKQKEEEGDRENKRCFYSNSISCYNSAIAMQTKIILQIPNPINAILDKALFESTLITKEKKQDIKKIQIFEAIAYLQKHNILISVMQDNTIKAISSNSPLAYLLSVYEFLPFICTNKDNNPLIQNMQDFKSLTQRATSTKVRVFSNTISEKMIEAYKNQTLLYGIETACRIFSKEKHKQEQKERRVEIVAKDHNVKIEKISDHSRKILEEIGRESGVSILLISSIARTPEQQARAMLNNIKNTGIKRQYKIYGSFGDIVLRTFEETLGMRNLQTISQAEEEQIIATMTQKIEEIGPHKVSKHCRKDIHILNVIDISLAKYANNTTIITSLRKAISKKMESGKISKFIDEQSQNCFHIEIPQPKNKEQ